MKNKTTENDEFFERFKDKDEEKFIPLSLHLKADRKLDKAKIIDRILNIIRQDINGLKELQKQFKKRKRLYCVRFRKFDNREKTNPSGQNIKMSVNSINSVKNLLTSKVNFNSNRLVLMVLWRSFCQIVAESYVRSRS